MDKRRMCPNCRAFISSSDRVCPYCEVELGPRAIERRSPADALGGLIPHARFTTMIILLINSGLYAATLLASIRAGNDNALWSIDGRTLFDFGAKLSAAVAAGQWWRLVTAGFLHGGLLHILMNSWVLFDLGAQVEEVYGASRLIVFYFLATLGGFAASTFWTPGLSVGASAGIFGLIGAMIAVGVRHKSALGQAIKGMYMRWALYGLLFGLLPGLAIDNAAHIGGLGAGFAVAYFADMPSDFRRGKETFWKWAAIFCLLATTFCFAQMVMWMLRTPKV